MKRSICINLSFILAFALTTCQNKTIPVRPAEVYTYNPSGKGTPLKIEFTRGKYFNHPLIAVWAEDADGNFLQTIYVSESIGKGVFAHGNSSSGKWMPGEVRRPAALPVWGHRRGIQASDGLYLPEKNNPVADAYTGPTPQGSFMMNTFVDHPSPKFTVWLEINQTWDWNEFWTNNKYADDEEYKTSCQPALVYKAVIDTRDPQKEYEMTLAGHSHYSGKTGEIFEDISTMTTALQIAEKIKVILK